MIVPQKIHPRTGVIVTMDEWHKGEILYAYKKLKLEINRYFNYFWAKYKPKPKKKKRNKIFLDKIDYWRKNGGLTVVTDDTTNPFKSMADGKYYTSKKKYRNEISARGYEEVGNDKQEHRVKDAYWADKKHDNDIKQDIAEVLNG
jgi:hypothetical protein|tara:strand:+ start:63 stop:497 length:435 start_codon:yes stop_codon:yes gene_type:complete